MKTCYHCNGLAETTTWDMSEVEWTWRLAYALPSYLPSNSKIDCLCENGEIFSDYQSRYSQIAFARMYYLKDAPDIIVSCQKKRISTDVLVMSDDGQSSEDEDDKHALMDFVSYPDSDSDYSTDEEIIELAKQKSAVNELTRLPEKGRPGNGWPTFSFGGKNHQKSCKE